MRTFWTAAAAVVMTALLLSACRSAPPVVPPPPPPRTYGVVELAGQAWAYRGDSAPAVSGTGSSAQRGDYVLENELAIFVVAAADRLEGGSPAGNLIDAAFQRGEDQMRLLVPLLGPGEGMHPVYESVRVEEEGGLHERAVVVAEGGLPDRPGVEVVTTYTLEPADERLVIKTTVRNETESMLARFGLRDMLYHGRTFRYVPGPGLFPTGRDSTSRWMAFFRDGYCWGLGTDPPDHVEGSHTPGFSVLRYRTVDIPPGEERSFTRRLLAGVGGPLTVWKAWEQQEDERTSRLVFELADEAGGAAVAEAFVEVEPQDGRPPFAISTDREGRAVAEVPAGRYQAMVWKPGRPVQRPFSFSAMAGSVHRFPLALQPATSLSVRLLDGTGEEAEAVYGRLHLSGRDLEGFAGRGPAFQRWPWLPQALVRPTEHGRLPVTTGRTSAGTVTAFRGPLHAVASTRVPSTGGQDLSLSAALERVIEPGDYVAVDFRQHSGVSPDCALTLAERAVLNVCEGLQGAVVSDPVLHDIAEGVLPEGAGALIPAFRWEWPGAGAFTVIPLEQVDAGIPARFVEAARISTSPDDVLETVRQFFRGAIVQIDKPLDPRSGVLALHGVLPGREFHLLEVLSGGDVASARRVMHRWFDLLNEGRRVVAVAGSGSVGLHPPVAGQGRTFIHCPDPDEHGAVLSAIERLRRSPNAFITNGPFLEVTLNGEPIGSTQTVPPGRVRMDLRVRAAPWVDLAWGRVFRNGELVREFPIEPSRRVLRSERTFEFEVTGDCWFVVQVTGEEPMDTVYAGPQAPTPFALTNPFWVEVAPQEDET